ncbi:hypothetical protein [Humibacter sp. RRB41]|uniref:hypothetical protein n=1 Tax=Humibacter sp. RRB41 TaxID=2919946 RepID=UPI001FAB3386|nr:hypothetical protein [Humibacter sp. RRB41]
MSEGYIVGSGLNGTGRYPRSLTRKATGDSRAWGWGLWLLFGIACGGIGLLPWLLTGMSLSVKNVWVQDAGASEVSPVLLPLSQTAAVRSVALIVVGSAAAGILARALHRHWSAGGFWALVGAVVLVQLGAAAQSVVLVVPQLGDGTASVAYLAVTILVVLLAVLAGVAVLTLIARAPRAGALLGIALVASPFALWIARFTSLYVPGDLDPIVTEALLWVPAAVVGVAIVWCGVNTFGRVLAAIVALALLWVGSPLTTALGGALGSRMLVSSFAGTVQHLVDVIRSALFEVHPALLPLGVAIVIAIVGSVLRALIGRARRARRASYDDSEQYDVDGDGTDQYDTAVLYGNASSFDAPTQQLGV